MYVLAVVPERDVAIHVNTSYKAVFQAYSEGISFLVISTCLKMFTTGHCPLPEVSSIQSTNSSPVSL
jgi:hypothetical protein